MLNYTNAPDFTTKYLEQVWKQLPPFIRPTFLLPWAYPELLKYDCELTIVSETFQYTGSFKFRAAYNLISSVPQNHIIAASSGNFGQAVAYASSLLGKTCTIVMPTTSADVKIAAVQAYGGEANLIDVQQVSRAERVEQLLTIHPGAFQAHAYDDYRVVAGNSTLGKEIFANNDFDVIIAPVGGGGLISGITVARDYLQRSTEIIGAEPLPGNDAARSFRAGTLLANEQEPATVADGARTISLGKLNWEILEHGLSDIIEVPDTLTLTALRRLFRYANLKVEPTGALAVAAVLGNPE
ncbi:MAG TPA: pyridoxal-phosphate dependent enzyme, partial [Ktedonobacteraceae bacterium]